MMRIPRWRLLVPSLFLWGAGACAPSLPATDGGGTGPAVGVGDGSDGTDGTDGTNGGSAAGVGGDLFDTDRLIEVELEMTDADWTALRRQTRSMFDVLAGDCMAEPVESPYSWFPAIAVIDGERVEDVEVRKKGFIGSLSTERPGLKLDFDNAVDDRLFYGLERMTLNNMRQDGTLIRTCLAYEHFRAAGAPAPRCSFVHLTVNDEDLGIYAHVETVNDRFVERLVGVDDVPLFEGSLSDLRDGWTATYDLDSDAADPDQIAPLVAAIESGDLDRIAQVFDLPDFLRFTAGEVMTGHWDGYGWNTNNYFLYIDPRDGLARFLPWGPDAAWSRGNPGGGLDWVSANSALPRAILSTEAGMASYREELDRQVNTVWNESDMLDRMSEMLDLISPHFRPQTDQRNWLGQLLSNQDDLVRAGLAGGAPDLSGPLRPELCLPLLGSITTDFNGTYGSIDGTHAPGTCTMALTWEGTAAGPVAGTHYTGEQAGRSVNGCVLPWGAGELLVYLEQPRDEHTPGIHVTDHTVTYGSLFYRDAASGWEWSNLSWMEGQIELTEAASSSGTAVAGGYTATLWQPAW